MGKLDKISNEEFKEKLRGEFTKQELFDVVNDFKEGVKKGDYAERGWPK